VSAELAQVETRVQPPRLSWCERQVQDAVYVHCAIKNHEIIVPNSCVFGWEADVITVNKTGFISEYEIKVSRSDFKADAKKERARILVDPNDTTWFGKTITHKRPNYFYYAVPEGLITPEEVPDYAGLLYVHKHVKRYALYYGTVTEVKAAKRIHRDKIEDEQRRQLARALTVRYWRQRLDGLMPAEELKEAKEADKWLG
jgi:hypothetical protein